MDQEINIGFEHIKENCKTIKDILEIEKQIKQEDNK